MKGKEEGILMKKVSVIVPCYNAAMYLPRCMDKLLSQTIGSENIEIILVDDASTDNGLTWGVISDYERKNPGSIIAIRLEENLRQGGARNVGISYAGGEFLIFCDADDWLVEEALERLYRAALEQNADVVECLYKPTVDFNGESCEIETGGGYSNELFDLDTEGCRKQFMIAPMQRRDITFGSQRKLYRTSLIKEHNIRFAEQLIFEEPSFVVPTRLYAHKWYFLNEMLYIYYMSPGSTMRGDWLERKWDSPKVWVHLLQELTERGALNQYYAEIEYLFVHWYMILTLRMWTERGYGIEVSELQQLQDTVLTSFPTVLQNKYLVERDQNGSWSGLALKLLQIRICDESVAVVNEILRNMIKNS